MILVGLLFIIIPVVNAGGLGMGPARIDINNGMRGYEYPNMVFVHSSFEEDVTLSLSVEGDCSDWISLYLFDDQSKTVTDIIVPPMSSTNLLAKIKIPEDALAGNYNCTIYAQQSVTPGEDEQAFAIRVRSDIKVEVTSEELPSGSIRGIEIQNPDVNQPLIIRLIFQNTGNVTATPRIEANITKNGEMVDTISYDETSTEPGDIKTIEIERSTTGWKTGEYKISMRVYLAGLIYERDDLFFKILETGSVSGEVVNVKAPEKISVGGTAKIEVDFKNTGNVDINAKIKSEVYKDNEMINETESSDVNIKSGETKTITNVIKPESEGNYSIKTDISYNGKSAEIDDINITVVGEENGSGTTGMTISYPLLGGIAVILVIVILIYFIKQRQEPSWKREWKKRVKR